MNALEELMLRISLVDRISRPMRAIDKLTRNTFKNFKKGAAFVAGGFAAIVGAGAGLFSILRPANELNNALKETASLGVADSVLKSLRKTALGYVSDYGGAAADFVRSSYDIQSAIAGLRGNELPQFTRAGNILAKATKAQADVITNYMGTMYGIFKHRAVQIGKTNWVNLLVGQTAVAVERFKLTGGKLAHAFASLGANATSHGVLMREQIAVLGTLSASVQGGVAGSQYRAFLKGVGKAQKQLGLTFSDSAGRMLAMPEILKRIKNKYGDLSKVADSDLITKAFGSDEATSLIKFLIRDIGGLEQSMTLLGKQKGMEKALKMAKTMIDPFERLRAASRAAWQAITFAALPAVEPYINKITALAKSITSWAEKYPHLNKLLGLTVIGLAGMTIAIGALAIVGGGLLLGLTALRFVLVGMSIPLIKLAKNYRVFSFLIKAGNSPLRALAVVLLRMTGALWLSRKALGALRFAMLALSYGVGAMSKALLFARNVVMALRFAWWVLRVSLLASPIGWVITGVTLLAGAILFLSGKVGGLKNLWGIFTDYWLARLKSVRAWFANFDISSAIINGIKKIFPWVQKLLSFLPGGKLIFGGGVAKQISAASNVTSLVDYKQRQQKSSSGLNFYGQQAARQPTPIGKQINQSVSRSQSQSISVGEVHVHNQGEAMNGRTLKEQLEQVAG